MRELRAHLQASSSAYQEMGLDPTEASRAAIAKFGTASHIGKSLAREATHPLAPLVALTIGMVCGSVMFLALDLFNYRVLCRVYLPYRLNPLVAIWGSLFGGIAGLGALARKVTPATAVLFAAIGCPLSAIAIATLLALLEGARVRLPSLAVLALQVPSGAILGLVVVVEASAFAVSGWVDRGGLAKPGPLDSTLSSDMLPN